LQTGQGSPERVRHVAALQAVVYPAMLVDVQKNIAAAAGQLLAFHLGM